MAFRIVQIIIFLWISACFGISMKAQNTAGATCTVKIVPLANDIPGRLQISDGHSDSVMIKNNGSFFILINPVQDTSANTDNPASAIELIISTTSQIMEDYHITIPEDTTKLSDNQGSIVFRKERLGPGDVGKDTLFNHPLFIVGEIHLPASGQKENPKSKPTMPSAPVVIRIDYY
jgi:hypothetical protein